MGNFTGKLNSNLIFAALFNMIISQQVFADNIKGTFSKQVDEAKVDGTLYGDTKLYYATDVLKSTAWGNDGEATNLLAIHRPPAPKVQGITIDIYRQISLTIDNYLTKQAWSTEGAFSDFNSVMLGWIRETKRVYDATTYNAYLGTIVADTQKIKELTVNEADYPTLGQGIGEVIANLFIDLEDATRDYNDYKFLRSYNEDEIKIVWNAKYVNKVKKIDLPALFHKDGLIQKFETDVLPKRYFGTVNDVSKTTADASTRSLVEQDVGDKHYFAGDLIDAGTTLVTGGTITVPTYQEDANIIAKILHRDSIPYMSAFEVATSFFNAKSLTENHYLTFGHNTLEYLKDKPLITLKLVNA